MRTSNADRVGLSFLICMTLLGLFAPSWSTLSSTIRQHVMPEQACAHVLVPALTYCAERSQDQPGEHQ